MSSICVYAICKNEAQFVDRWMDSMQEADQVVVLDTGSTDETVQKLKRRGALVTQEQITPWRFDSARNRSLELVPEEMDICVCTDLDEVFQPGWRQQVEAAWTGGVNQLRYRYIWTFRPDGSEGHVYWLDKIHARHGFYWEHPVHEILHCRGPVQKQEASGVVLEHHPDPDKSRGQYLPLLELAFQERPDDDRNVHYLGREYVYYGRWDEAIAMLKTHLLLPSATWADERCASMRLIARAYSGKNDPKQVEAWLLRAVAEAPYLREPWMDLAIQYYRAKQWEGLIWAVTRLLTIQEKTQSYICEPEAWSEQPYDLLSLGYYYTGQYKKALTAVDTALSMAPNDGRLQENRQFILQAANSPA